MTTCSDKLSPESLTNAQLDAVFLAEISTSRAGGVSTGDLIYTATNRHGDTTDTAAGRLAKMGFADPVPYDAGISFTIADDVKTISRPDDLDPSTSTKFAAFPDQIPFTTTGDWSIDSSKFFVVQGGLTSDSIINDLSQSYDIDTVGDMVSSSVNLPLGKLIKTKGRVDKFDDGGATYLVQNSSEYTEIVDNTFYAFDLTNGLIAVLQEETKGEHNLLRAGGVSGFEAVESGALAGDKVVIPAGEYEDVSFTFDKVEIRGVGSSTQLKSDGVNPVLVPQRHIEAPLHDWDYMKVSDMYIDGNLKAANGIQHDTDSEFAGRWVYENISFRNCNKAVAQTRGQIGGRYSDISIRACDFGFWLQDEREGGLMHAGNKLWENVHIDQCSFAAVYIADITNGSGQLTFNNLIAEQNDGYGMLINGVSQFVPVSPLTLNQAWFETNGKINEEITIGDYTAIPNDATFLDAKVVNINGTYVKKMLFSGTTAVLDTCRMDSSSGSYEVTVTNNAAMIIRNFYGNDTRAVKEYIQNFAHATEWNGTGTNNGAQYMAHRAVKIKGGWYGYQESETFEAVTTWTGGASIAATDGILFDTCAQLPSISDGGSTSFVGAKGQIIASKWNVITLAFKVVVGEASHLSVRLENGLGPFISLTSASDRRKFGQWYTAVALVPCNDRAGEANMAITARAIGGAVTPRFADFQSMAFDTKQDALNYIDNREYQF